MRHLDPHAVRASQHTPRRAGTRVAAIVAAHRAPVARRAHADQHYHSPEQAMALAVTLTMHQQVHFDVERHAGPQGLNPRVRQVGDAGALQRCIDAALATAQGEAEQALALWAGRAALRYRRVLAPHETLCSAPQAFGFERSCPDCSAARGSDCALCLSSGIVHEWASVQARVERSELLQVASDDEVVRAMVGEQLVRQTLPDFGALLDVQHVLTQQGVCSTYSLRLDVTRAPLLAAEHSFDIYGVGPAPRVLDFSKQASRLLEDELAELVPGGAAPFGLQRDDSAATSSPRQFVKSQLNVLLARQVAEQHLAAGDR